MPKSKASNNKLQITTQPTSTAVHVLHEIIEAGRDGIKDLPERKREINRRAEYAIEKSGIMEQNILIDFKNASGNMTIEMPHDLFDRLTGECKSNVKKMFQFVLEAVNKQALHNGELAKDTVDISAYELVDIGLYCDERSSRRGFDTAMSFLTSIKIKGSFRYNPKGKPVHISILSVMFYTVEHKNNVFTVFLNPTIDWNFIVYFFSHIPEYYYSLSSKAASMTYQIFYLARQNTKNVKEKGCFRISMKVIRNALSLPSRTKHPRRDIIEPIYSAIDEIEEAHKKHFNNEELYLLPVECNDNMNATEFIKFGFLEVYITGELARPFIEFEEEKIKNLKKTQQKAQRIKERAKAIALSKEISK